MNLAIFAVSLGIFPFRFAEMCVSSLCVYLNEIGCKCDKKGKLSKFENCFAQKSSEGKKAATFDICLLVLLSLLRHWLMFLPLFVGVLCFGSSFLMHFLVPFLLMRKRERERVGCFTFIAS